MNIHIELDPHGRGIVFWIADDQTGSGATVHARDPYNVNSIDFSAEERLRKLLQIATDDNWSAYGFKPTEFASAISQILTDLSSQFSQILKDTPSFRIPDPLRIALSETQAVLTVDEWINRYPIT